MKKILVQALAVVIVLGVLAGQAGAANGLQEASKGFSVGVGKDTYQLSGRYFIYDGLAVLGGLGFNLQGGDRDQTDFGLFAGARQYLSRGDFAFFVGGAAGYAMHGEDGSDNDTSFFRVEGNGGAEYFFDSAFSVEGSVGGGLQFGKIAKDDVYSIGTFTRSLAVNFYF